MDNKARQARVRQLVSASSELDQIRRTCKHDWGPLLYDPEETFIQRATGELEVHGSDVWPKSEFVPGKRDRWSETCSICLTKRYYYSKK